MTFKSLHIDIPCYTSANSDFLFLPNVLLSLHFPLISFLKVYKVPTPFQV